MNLPNVNFMERWVNNFAPDAPGGSRDFLQLVRQSDGSILGWIDESGIPHGGLAVPGPAGAPGATGSISATQGPSPWSDANAFGGNQRVTTGAPESTTLSGTADSGQANVSLTAAKDFQNGDGVVIYGAGAATAQSTPSAPTVTSPVVGGSTEYDYKIIGVDALGGLTAASAVGKTTSGPAILGNSPVNISSITQAMGVITVNFSTAINASANQQIVLSGISGTNAPNGVQAIASAPTTSSITITYSPSIGSLTGGTGRLANSFNIASISRSGNTVTVATNANHNFLNPGSTAPCIVVIDGATPADLNGQFVLTNPSGTGFEYKTGISDTVTGSGGTATVYEYNVVTCPAYAGTTVQYYIYSNQSGSYLLIGKTLPNDSTFVDYGPWWNSGYVAPSYVPTTPPVVAQAQLFASTISSGGGTTSLALANNLGTTVGSGTVIVHDDSSAFVAAAAVGTAFVSPRPGPWIISYPITISVPIIVASGIIFNETVTANEWKGFFGGSVMGDAQFGERLYFEMTGEASPMISTGNGALLDGIGIYTSNGGGNGQIGVLMQGSQTNITNCQFFMSGYTCIPLVYQGGTYGHKLEGIAFGGETPMGATPAVGQIDVSANIPAIWLKGYSSSAGIPGDFVMTGNNTGTQRGILVDFSLGDVELQSSYFIENIQTYQSPQNPLLMFYGGGTNPFNVILKNVTCDSNAMAALANWTVLENVLLESVSTPAGAKPMVTGNPIGCLEIKWPVVGGGGLGQTNDLVVSGGLTGIAVGPLADYSPVALGETLHSRPLIMGGSTPYPLAVQLQVAGVTAAQSASAGTIPAGTYQVVVAAVGWNGGQTAVSAPVSVTVDGSHDIDVTWESISGVQGFYVYANYGFLSALIANTSTTISAHNGNFTEPTGDGTGMPLIDSTQVASVLFRILQGFFKVDVTPTTLTANRTATMPDASGNVLLNSGSGIGNGSSGDVTVPAKNTGTGPATPGTIVGFTKIVDPTLGTIWVPYMQ